MHMENRLGKATGLTISATLLLEGCVAPAKTPVENRQNSTPIQEVLPTRIPSPIVPRPRTPTGAVILPTPNFGPTITSLAKTQEALANTITASVKTNTQTPTEKATSTQTATSENPALDYQKQNLERIANAKRGDVIELNQLRLYIWRTPWLGGDAYWARLLANYPGKIRFKQADCVYDEYSQNNDLGDPVGDAEWQPEKTLKSAVVYVSISQSKFVDPFLTFLQITYDNGTETGETITCDVDTLEEDAKNAWNNWKAKIQTPAP